MILYIESVYGDVLLHGKRMEESELRKKADELLKLVGAKDFLSAFCMRYDYEKLPFDPYMRVDYVVDLDTNWVYKPVYNT